MKLIRDLLASDSSILNEKSYDANEELLTLYKKKISDPTESLLEDLKGEELKDAVEKACIQDNNQDFKKHLKDCISQLEHAAGFIELFNKKIKTANYTPQYRNMLKAKAERMKR